MLILGDTGSWDVRRARSRVRVGHTEVCKKVGKGGGGRASHTRPGWGSSVVGGFARFLTSALDVHVVYSLGRGLRGS